MLSHGACALDNRAKSRKNFVSNHEACDFQQRQPPEVVKNAKSIVVAAELCKTYRNLGLPCLEAGPRHTLALIRSSDEATMLFLQPPELGAKF